MVEYSGDKKILIVRRLRCTGCGRIHHELPDLIVPYKRYSCEAVEFIISTSKEHEDDYPCELSTSVRLKIWFFLLRQYFRNTLVSLTFLYDYDRDLCNEINQLLPCLEFGLGFTGWLKKLVRFIVNSGRWLHTRSA